jgi:hypothetical protein
MHKNQKNLTLQDAIVYALNKADAKGKITSRKKESTKFKKFVQELPQIAANGSS